MLLYLAAVSRCDYLCGVGEVVSLSFTAMTKSKKIPSKMNLMGFLNL